MKVLLILLLLGICGYTDEHYDYTDYKKELDELTRLLCEAGKVHRKEKEPPKDLLKWWKKHQKEDKNNG